MFKTMSFKKRMAVVAAMAARFSWFIRMVE